ncbi:DHA2 family efflux MFS transporter permease subunit [Aldersonia sp. NBC_00410]|uniref:DHA2 family efflux MFS transporter permease subunit n=1 Tax=Aldersonia sp. NBC_00410 TaxID=2975954 RepID=UPI00224FF69C|nr:DHA2 family efflux MFS transporter permease subunit [Aldersonia sp. NBC_00410]MCX5043702.1 DHA2 family efflux MFS transporter permease subunit [Aldersonia sp. NBC_00410]
MTTERNPWIALGALCVGFFMILLDMTIVAVANPAILTDLQADVNSVVWVTSAYLLAFAAPLLVTGRLGDKYGPKNVYLVGLTVFTAASLWCALSPNIETLIAARAVQGLGASLMTPQTMAVITRIFPPDKRGAAMGAWGAVAGIATLVGPILGGVLVDSLGWEWIFLVNVPVGIVAFVLAVRFVPALPTNEHKFDIPGVILSALGMFLLVFGIQEGSTYDWSGRIWLTIAAGVILLGVFVYYQSRSRGEPLLPLELFRDRNFSLANVGISAMGAAVTAMMLPTFFYLQAVHGYSPTKSALVFAPMAVVTGIFAPLVGRLVDRTHPRIIPTFGFTLFALSLLWFTAVMNVDTPAWQLMLPAAFIGLANACIWAPLGATATHNLPMHQAGAGAGVYNTTRQVGSVLGSAGVGALITARMAAQGLGGGAGEGSLSGPVPEPVKEAFSTALSESLLLPAAILVIGVVASLFFVRPAKPAPGTGRPAEEAAVAPNTIG